MKKQKIALFANAASKQLEEIGRSIKQKGQEPIFFDIQLGMGKNIYHCSFEKNSWNGIDFSDIQAVHIRCSSPRVLPTLPAVINEQKQAQYKADFIKEQQFNSSTVSFFNSLVNKDKLVVNPLQASAYLDHESKSQLYLKLKSFGLSAPDTITTNFEKKAYEFIEKHEDVVIKPSIGVGSTRQITKGDKARLKDLCYSPVMFQEKKQGDTIRVHVVGEKIVLALRIISGENVDSRTDAKGFEYIKLEDAQEKQIIKASKLLKVHYCAWDVLLTKQGEIFLLDCNPGPYVMWIGEKNRKEVFNQLANMLIEYSKTNDLQKAYDIVEPVIVK